VIATLQLIIYCAFFVIIFGLAAWALIDAVRRPAQAYVSAGKRTKQFWGLVLGAATAVAFVAIPYPLGIGFLPFLALLSAVAAIVYLVDVRPAVTPYSGGRGPRSGGGSGSSRGGW
jgi:hypothetical protein